MTGRRVLIAAVAVLTTVASGGASAQAPAKPLVGSHIPRKAGERDAFNTYSYSREEADREFATYSGCVVGDAAGERKAAAFLRMIPDSPEWSAAGRKLTDPDCLRSAFGQVTMRFNLVSLRPALFAAMYRRKFAKVEPVGFDAAPPLALETLYDGSTIGFPRQALVQLNFGNCVARTDALAAHRLLVSRPWSDAEDAALPAVTTAMGKCLPPNETLRMNRSTARGVLAEAMYHLASGRAAGAVTADAAAAKGR